MRAEKELQNMNHIFDSKDLPKQFCCLVDGTKNSIFIKIVLKHPRFELAFKIN